MFIGCEFSVVCMSDLILDSCPRKLIFGSMAGSDPVCTFSVSLGMNHDALHQVVSVSYWLHQHAFWSLMTRAGRGKECADRGKQFTEENHLLSKRACDAWKLGRRPRVYHLC